MTQLYAVAGNPIFHSRSPAMFNTAFRELAMDAVYVRFAASTAEEIVRTARQTGMAGLNITTPFKADISRLLDGVDSDAELVGAVNTVVRRPEGLIGYNTDLSGALGAAGAAGFRPSGQKVVVLGAGGAARAAALAFVKAGSRVVIVNRTFEKAREAAGRIGCEAAGLGALSSVMGDARLLVSAVSSAERVVDPCLLEPPLIVLDALYARPSALSADAATRGCVVIDGREWLLAQAAPAFELFTGRPAPLEHMRKVLFKRRIDSRKNIALIGFMAAGKSTIGERVAEIGGMAFVDIDKEIEKKAAVPIAQIFEQSGEETFRLMEQAEIDSLRLVSHRVASCGGGAVGRKANMRVLRNNCLSVWLWADVASILDRVGSDPSRPLLNGRGAKSARALLDARMPFYAACADMLVSTEGKSPEKIAERIWHEVRGSFTD